MHDPVVDDYERAARQAIETAGRWRKGIAQKVGKAIADDIRALRRPMSHEDAGRLIDAALEEELTK